jgi:chorismate mutase/prephenate dehydratase
VTREVADRRRRIEAIDDEIVRLIAERAAIAREIGTAKRDARAATLDPGREAAVIRRAVENGRARGLAGEPLREIFWAVVGLCRSAQLEDR